MVARRGDLGAGLLVLTLLGAVPGAAQRVPIGRFTEVALGGSSGHPYAMSGGDVRRSGRSPARVAPEPERLWQLRLPHRRVTPPAALADGRVVLGSSSGVHGVDPSGRLLWSVALGPVLHTPVVMLSGELLVLTANGALHRIDAHGRATQLATHLPGLGTPLLLDSGMIVAGGRDGQLHLIDSDGTRLDSLPTSQHEPQWTAQWTRDRVVAGGRSQTLSLLSVHTGELRELKISERLATSPVVADDGTLWLAGEHGTLVALSPSGRVLVRRELGAISDGLAIGRDGGVRVGLVSGELLGLDRDGRELFRRTLDGRSGALLLDADDTVLLVTSRGTLYAIARDGELRYRRSLGVRAPGRPVLGHDGTLYVVSQSGQLEAWR